MGFKRFLTDQSGAVTVDWVVLSASVVGLGIGSVGAVRTGVWSLGGSIETSLTGASVATLRTAYFSGYLPQHLADNRAAVYSSATTDEILGWHRQRVDQLLAQIASGQLVNSAWSETSPWTNNGAGQNLDIIELHVRELQARGAYPVDGVPDIDTLRAAFDARFGG